MVMGGDSRTWHATIHLPSKEPATITVEAIDEKGWPAYDTVCISSQVPEKNVGLTDGSGAASIGAWPENGIFGTQLGPNRNAKPLHK
jgi:hypothetical protein